MDDDDVKQQALEQAQQAYGLFIWVVKWFSYIMITLIVIMFMNNWFDDGTDNEETLGDLVEDLVYFLTELDNIYGVHNDN